MASTGLLQLSLSAFDGSGQTLAETYSLSNASLNEDVSKAFAFATGDNVITKPTGATHLVISNIFGTIHLYASGNPSLVAGMLVLIPVPGTTITINAAAGATASLTWAV